MRIKQIGKLYKTYQKQLYVSAIAITKNRELAEDAVHDALIAVTAVETDIKDLKAYLFSVVRNKAIYACTRNNLDNSLDGFIEVENCTQNDKLFAAQIIKYLQKLPPEQQQTIIMKIFGGLTFKEIAELTNNPLNTVASWYRRGLAILQEKFNDK